MVCTLVVFLYLIDFLIGIINELHNTSDLESTFRRIAKDKSDCSSGQRGGRKIFF